MCIYGYVFVYIYHCPSTQYGCGVLLIALSFNCPERPSRTIKGKAVVFWPKEA